MPTKEEYQADVEARAKLTEQQNLATSQSQPTPTQEENDLLRLGLMHVDEKVSPDNPEMPPVAVQQLYVQQSIANAGAGEPPPEVPVAMSASTARRGPGRPPRSASPPPPRPEPSSTPSSRS
jgi:hypothetical protein